MSLVIEIKQNLICLFGRAEVRSKCLSEPIYINFEELYSKFQEVYGDKEKRVRLFGKFIFVDYSRFIKGKSELFWHLSSIESTEKYSVNPCTNEVPLGECKYINHCENNENMSGDDLVKEIKRIPCIYRGSRIIWIDEIIKLASEESKLVKVWEVYVRKTGKTKIKLRFQSDTVDYIIILIKNLKTNSYKLITAFPVVYKASKRKFDKQYDNYLKSIKK